jgi:solute carrier family 25 protein 34/35
VLFTNPAEVVKTRLQLDGEGGGRPRQYRGVADALLKIGRQEGLAGLQKGLVPALAYQVAMNGCRLGLYEPMQRMYHAATGLERDSTLLRVLSGASSGMVGATLGSPLYLVKNRLQASSTHFAAKETHAYSGAIDGLRKIYAAEGVRGLFRGVDGAQPRVMVGSATQLSTYDHCKGLAAQAGLPPGVAQHAAASFISSLVTVTMMNPFDVVSTRLYQSAGRATRYAGPLDCGIKTVRAEGWAALQKGWLAQYARLGPHTIITFLLLEQVKPVFLGVSWLTEPATGAPGTALTLAPPAAAPAAGAGAR